MRIIKKMNKELLAKGFSRMSDFPECGEKKLICYLIADQLIDELKLSRSEAYMPMWLSSQNCMEWIGAIGIRHHDLINVFKNLQENNGDENLSFS